MGMGDMGQRFAVLVKAVIVCILIFDIGAGLNWVLRRLGFDKDAAVAWTVNIGMLIVFCILGWMALRWSDKHKNLKK